MNVLIACEYSGVVKKAFERRGHYAWSCDILPSEEPYRHIQGDIFELLDRIPYWDLMIAHPPCTYLCNSGVRWLYSQEDRWEKMEYGASFFKKLLNHRIKKIAIENPIMHKHAVNIIGRRQDQILQPYMFGHTEKKATGLWLKNLPKLEETNNVYEEMLLLPKNEQNRIHYMAPSANRAMLRSRTYTGIANAMAEQWG